MQVFADKKLQKNHLLRIPLIIKTALYITIFSFIILKLSNLTYFTNNLIYFLFYYVHPGTTCIRQITSITIIIGMRVNMVLGIVHRLPSVRFHLD